MKWLASLLACACVLLTYDAVAQDDGAARPPQPKRPRLELSSPAIECGTVYAGEEIESEFEVKNVGTGVLTVSTRPDCSCVAFTSIGGEIEPGKSRKFTLRNQTGKGHLCGVTLLTNDPDRAQVQVPIEGTVLPLLEWPESLMLEGRWDETRTKSIEIKNVSGRPVTIQRAVSTRSFVEAKGFEPVAGEKGWRLKLESRPTGRWERLRDSVELTVHADERSFPILLPVQIVRTPPIEVTPTGTLSLSRGYPRSNGRRELTLTSEHRDFRVLAVAVEGVPKELVDAICVTEKPNRAYRIVVSLPEQAPHRGRFHRGELVVRTDDPDQPEIRRTLSVRQRFAEPPTAGPAKD